MAMEKGEWLYYFGGEKSNRALNILAFVNLDTSLILIIEEFSLTYVWLVCSLWCVTKKKKNAVGELKSNMYTQILI